MSNTKFTRGPWESIPSLYGKTTIFARFWGDTVEVATIPNHVRDFRLMQPDPERQELIGTQSGNIALITTATELYSALEACLSSLTAMYIMVKEGQEIRPDGALMEGDVRPSMDESRAALAKARGEVFSGG